MKTQRIDGTDYIVGTPEHRMAVAMTRARFDAAYLAAHHADYERNQRMLRDFERLDSRVRTDANATAFLARELLFVRPQIERTIYDRLRAKEFIPVDTSIPRGAQSYATQIMDGTGEAAVTHDLAGDSPRVDVSKDEDIRKLVNIRASYAYTVQDLEYAAQSGTPLIRWKAERCADAIARGLDKIARIGEAPSGLTGFLNDANVPTVTLTNGEWLTATAAEIIADFFQVEQALISTTRDGVTDGYRMVLPTAYDGRLATLKADTYSELTVKEWLLRNARLIRSIERWIALDDATAAADVGVSDPPEGVVYKMDPSQLFWPVPIMFEEQIPQLKGWEWLVDTRARCGGVEWRRPSEAAYMENLD